MKEQGYNNKIEEKKSKIKERFKLKLEYSEKIKNNENNKVLKKLNNIKKNELPKIKVLNYLNSNTENSESFHNPTNIDKNYIIYNKIKKGLNLHNKNIKNNKINNSTKVSSQNLQNMNLISYNENINNIYKKVTINDFNNKDIDQKAFYEMIQNFNILDSNSNNDKKDNIDFKQTNNIPPKNLYKSFNNEKIVFNILNQGKEDNNTNEVNNNVSPENKNEGNRFNFLRKNRKHETIKLRKPIFNEDKYHTNKVSPRKLVLDYNEDNDIIESKQNKINNELNSFKNKRKLYKEDDDNFINENNNWNKYFTSEIKNKYLNYRNNKDILNNKSEAESSDVTIISLKSEEIKDLSSNNSEF